MHWERIRGGCIGVPARWLDLHGTGEVSNGTAPHSWSAFVFIFFSSSGELTFSWHLSFGNMLYDTVSYLVVTIIELSRGSNKMFYR